MSEKSFYIFLYGFVAAFGLMIVLSYVAHNEAMTVCQLSHSHDVCFQALNR